MSAQRADVIVMGGGLAGLTLALQLKQRLPQLEVLVLERSRHPVPEATHKVGESSVEIAANYFDTVLGLKEHLATRQFKKFGFRFFFSDRRRDVDAVVELGASRYLTTPSYQLDRGIFENFLGATVRHRGVRFLDGALIRGFDLAAEDHSVIYEHDGRTSTARARWLIDAAGRTGLMRRRLGLTEDNGHAANAVWFRIGARIDVNEWSSDRAWLERCSPPWRWLSTNHLVGAGYWVWLIPLASGSHSVGIVADSRMHPSKTLDSFDKAMAWLETHQPRLAQDLRGKCDLLQDFAYLRRFSYGCRQVFSGERWALTGEAGVFLDPFYSPGGDFIAIANTYITELIAKDHAGEPIQRAARIYERFFLSFYESTLSLYLDQYPLFGDARVLPLKVIWDYTYYWGVLCQLFFQRRLTDLPALNRVHQELAYSKALNFAMQGFLREWAQVSQADNPPIMLDQAQLGWFAELNRGLCDSLDDDGFTQRLRTTTSQLRALAAEMAARASEEQPQLDAGRVMALLGGVQPQACAMLSELYAHRAVASAARSR